MDANVGSQPFYTPIAHLLSWQKLRETRRPKVLGAHERSQREGFVDHGRLSYQPPRQRLGRRRLGTRRRPMVSANGGDVN